MRMLAVIAVSLTVLGGCASKSPSTSQTRPSSTAKVAIVAPTSGVTIDGKDVEVKLTLVGGRITKLVTTHIQPNIGHIHLRLDGTTILILGSLDNHVKNVKPGQHVLEAEFVAADHLPFVPDVLSAVTFTAK